MSDNVEHVDFPFAAARRITSEEVAAAKLAVKEQFGIEPEKRVRPPKPRDQKYEAVLIRFNPQVLLWAKAEGNSRSWRLRQRLGVGYQTVINEALLKLSIAQE